MTAKEQKEFTLLKKDVGDIKIDVSETKESVLNIDKIMTKLTIKLFNDEDTGQKGYFSVLDRHGIRLTRLENWKVALLAFFGTFTGVLGILIGKFIM